MSERKANRGLTKTPEYRTWAEMKTRCFNPKASCFRDYGGRGITMCQSWVNSFHAFLADMGPKPGRGFSIDRIDNNGSYEPGNCRWATASEQARNKRTSLYVDVDGVRTPLKTAAEQAGIGYYTFRKRVRRANNPLVSRPHAPKPRGGACGSATLTDAQVHEILDALDAGCGQGPLAERYGVKPRTIRAIKSGQNWKHIHAEREARR